MSVMVHHIVVVIIYMKYMKNTDDIYIHKK